MGERHSIRPRNISSRVDCRERRSKEFFIVSKVILGGISENGNTRIEVKKSAAKKCLRCWNYRDSVSDNPQKLEVCRRCYDIVYES